MEKISNDRIRSMLAFTTTFCADTIFYHSGLICRGTKFSYYLEKDGSIWRNYNILADKGLSEWEKVATPEMVVTAIAGADVSKKCQKVSTDSLFQSGGTLSTFNIYSRDYKVRII